MIISIALICGVAFGDVSSWALLMLGVTWIGDVAISAVIFN